MKRLRIILTGAEGQLGRSLQQVAQEQFPEIEIIATDREELDICKQDALEDYLRSRPSYLPTMLINCAAYTAVDKAEEDDEAAYALNSFAPGYLALSCSAMDMMMIHLSTDYVFDGEAREPYLEDSSTSPRSVYGETKAVGEENVQRFLGLRSLVVRTAWLYSPFGGNFVDTMLRLSRERRELSVVDDQIGSPTYSLHLAEALLQIALQALERGYFPVGTIHYTNTGSCSWYQLAKRAIELMGNGACTLRSISTSEYGATKAQRPKYSVLSHRWLMEHFGIVPPTWEEGLLALKEDINKL